MINYYSIKCFVVEPSEGLKATLTKLVTEQEFMIDRGWENGYHLHLRGPLDDESLPAVLNELKNGISDSLTEYDETVFRKKYESTAKILNRSNPFNPIFKGTVKAVIENSIFEQELEDELFRKSNHIFDSYYCEQYFKKNSIYDVIEEALKFHSQLEAYETPGTTNIKSKPYNCHLSHYIAFTNKLNPQDKESIEKQFKLRFERDLKEGLLDFNLSPTTLTHDLIDFSHKIRPLIRNKQLNFYMPLKRKLMDELLPYASKRHQVTFSEENMRNHIYDEVLIANRWMTNALYKKLLLLGISNLERFYLNYVISRLVYPVEELTDYEVTQK